MASGYNMGFHSMTQDLRCTEFQATAGLSTFAFGFGIVPLFSASFSEEFGRQPMYYASAAGTIVSLLTIAL